MVHYALSGTRDGSEMLLHQAGECTPKQNKSFFHTGLSKKMDGIWNRYNLKSTGRIYTFGVLKYW